MAVYLDDVAFWVEHWRQTGEPITTSIARTIATYWQSAAETGALARFALDGTVSPDLAEDIDSTIRYVRAHFDTAELDALKAWLGWWSS